MQSNKWIKSGAGAALQRRPAQLTSAPTRRCCKGTTTIPAPDHFRSHAVVSTRAFTASSTNHR